MSQLGLPAPRRLVQRSGRKGSRPARRDRQENPPPRSSARTFATSALNLVRKPTVRSGQVQIRLSAMQQARRHTSRSVSWIKRRAVGHPHASSIPKYSLASARTSTGRDRRQAGRSIYLFSRGLKRWRWIHAAHLSKCAESSRTRLLVTLPNRGISE